MKHYKTMTDFRRALRREIAWADDFTIGNTRYYMYEYGDADSGYIVYFYSKKAHRMIEITYTLKPYSFRHMFINYRPILWRTDTIIG